jgi:protein involved in polysaccharide export with SLBB domain
MGNLNKTRVFDCTRYAFPKQIFAYEAEARIWIVAVAIIALCVGSATGQSYSPSTQSSNCSDPNTGYSTDCQSQSQPQGQSQGVPSTNSQQSRSSQTPDSTSRDVYVDRAGFPDANSPEQQQQRRLQRPEPPTEFQKLAQQSTGEMLPIFGRDLFRRAPSTFAPVDQVPASADYVLGPGDEVIVRMWGHDTLNARLTVDRSGSIYIPHIGGVDVAGLRFGDLQDHLRQELSRAYRNFDLSVNLGKLRSIQIFVLGEAYSPGSYTVSSLSTIFNALLTAGGPTPQGSMRNVQLRRGSQTVATLDLYDFILKGDRSRDLVLQAGDVIYVPFVGGQVAVSGSVRHPAIYEILPDSNVDEVLKEAGGLNSTAGDTHISIERIEEHHERLAMNIKLDHTGLATNLIDGDVLHVNPILDGYKNTVTIRGNLANPGRFPWHPGMKLSDIIPDRESLLTKDYWRQRNRLGLPTPLFEPSVNQSVYLNRRTLNQEFDRNRSGTRGQSNLNTADGGVDNNDSNLSPYPQDSARDYTDQLDDRSRDGVDSQDQYSTQQYSNQQYPDSDQQYSTQQNYSGQNRRPGLQQGSLADQQATSTQNLAPNGQHKTEIKVEVPEIDWSYAVIQRLDPKTLRNSLVPFDLAKLVDGHDQNQDMALQPGDIVTILSQNDILVRQDEKTKYVRLEGEFVNSGVYSVEPGQTLADVVRRAGGLTDKAYLYGASFTRETARVLQQQRLNEYISQLSANLERSSIIYSMSTTTPTAVATGDPFGQQRALLNEMRTLRATGRVVLQFKPDSVGEASIPAIPLEDGDTFRVPSKPIIVSVVGAVYGQNVFLYNSKYRVRDYLQLAGKPNRIADKKNAFIIRADGSVYSSHESGGLWSEHLESTPVYAGDTVVMPEKPIRPSAIRDLIDWSQVFSSFGVAAAAIQVLR